jgi:hypothetical protein
MLTMKSEKTSGEEVNGKFFGEGLCVAPGEGIKYPFLSSVPV